MPKQLGNSTRQPFAPPLSAAQCDRRDEKLTKVSNWEKTAAQERFLIAYTESPCVASAARSAGVARCTVYRWLESTPEFGKAFRDAWEQHLVWARAKAMAAEAERRRWRQERERARHPMRCANLVKARAALKEALRRRGGRKHRPW